MRRACSRSYSDSSTAEIGVLAELELWRDFEDHSITVVPMAAGPCAAPTAGGAVQVAVGIEGQVPHGVSAIGAASEVVQRRVGSGETMGRR